MCDRRSRGAGKSDGAIAANVKTAKQQIEEAKGKGAFVVDWYTSEVDNPSLSVALRSVTATPQAMERNLSVTLKDGESVYDAIRSLQDTDLAFEIQIPKYRGTDKQVRYAQKLAEAYTIDFASAVAQRWNTPGNRTKIREALESKGRRFSGNEYAKYMMESSKTLTAIQGAKKAEDVITLLKDKVSIDMIAYNNAPLGFAMRKGRKF